jgi:hypothetical protein
MKKNNELILMFKEELKKIDFREYEVGEFDIEYSRGKVKICLYFGRYSELPDISVRFEDDEYPEIFNVSSAIFNDAFANGLESPLKELDDYSRLRVIIYYFLDNHQKLLSKEFCRNENSKLDKYLRKKYPFIELM